MTDNEIIKSAEQCINGGNCADCLYDNKKGGCRGLTTDLLDLINQQKVEIERYKQEQNEINAMLDRLGVILFGSREEWEKKLKAHIDKQRKEDEKR